MKEHPRVLLADDDASTRGVLASVLRDMGLDVVEAADGGRMLVALASRYRPGGSAGDFDLVITDVVMPIASGLQLLAQMRATHWNVPVLVISGNPSESVREHAAMYGATMLAKPLDLETFERTVRGLLET